MEPNPSSDRWYGASTSRALLFTAGFLVCFLATVAAVGAGLVVLWTAGRLILTGEPAEARVVGVMSSLFAPLGAALLLLSVTAGVWVSQWLWTEIRGLWMVVRLDGDALILRGLFRERRVAWEVIQEMKGDERYGFRLRLSEGKPVDLAPEIRDVDQLVQQILEAAPALRGRYILEEDEEIRSVVREAGEA